MNNNKWTIELSKFKQINEENGQMRINNCAVIGALSKN